MLPDVEENARRELSEGRKREALTVLMRGYGDKVLRVCRTFLRDAELAKDVRQKVFVQAFRDLETCDETSTFCAWLWGITRNRCLDAIKSERRRDARHARVHPVVHGREDTLELSQLLAFCLEELDADKRQAVVSHHVLGHGYAELEAMLKASVAALQKRVARALVQLRGCVQEHGGQL